MKIHNFVVILLFVSACTTTTSEKKDSIGYKLNPDADRIIEKKQDGVLIAEYPYNDKGKINGIVVKYYNDGTVNQKITVKNGIKEGKAIWYYENGNKYIEANYKKDEYNGKLKKYYENGQLMSETLYKNGKLQTGTIEYNELGEKLDTLKIQIAKHDQLAFENRYRLVLHLNREVKYVKYYKIVKTQNGTIRKYALKNNDQKAIYDIPIHKGATRSEFIRFLAEGKTKTGNIFATKLKYYFKATN